MEYDAQILNMTRAKRYNKRFQTFGNSKIRARNFETIEYAETKCVDRAWRVDFESGKSYEVKKPFQIFDNSNIWRKPLTPQKTLKVSVPAYRVCREDLENEKS